MTNIQKQLPAPARYGMMCIGSIRVRWISTERGSMGMRQDRPSLRWKYSQQNDMGVLHCLERQCRNWACGFETETESGSRPSEDWNLSQKDPTFSREGVWVEARGCSLPEIYQLLFFAPLSSVLPIFLKKKGIPGDSTEEGNIMAIFIRMSKNVEVVGTSPGALPPSRKACGLRRGLKKILCWPAYSFGRKLYWISCRAQALTVKYRRLDIEFHGPWLFSCRPWSVVHTCESLDSEEANV
ncbi:hypothetical protein DFH27DRAFT_302608 [Peziza echinospora]|nr:hypothetical protein DFH27DRAFT_302608 [Peziza echinospora]